MAGVPDPVRIEAGDCLLLPRGRAFRVASDLALTPVNAETFYAKTPECGITTFNGGGEFFGFAGNFELSGMQADILLSVLPPIVHLRKKKDRAALRWAIEQMMQELREPQPGGIFILEHLACAILVQALRLHLAEGLKGGVGWLFALADKQMSDAIHAMHNQPGHRWTLEALSGHAAMSRSAFAAKFKETVGVTPMNYLTRWRMMWAGDKLINSDVPVSVIARSVSYESESAFSAIFKRIMGCSPRQFSHRKPARPYE